MQFLSDIINKTKQNKAQDTRQPVNYVEISNIFLKKCKNQIRLLIYDGKIIWF